jgi:hypothetical protein
MAGCSPPDGLNRGGDLSGAVTIDGIPVGGGRVEIFSADEKNSVGCQIRPDGTYTLSEPPLGECKIVVKTSQLKGMPAVVKTKEGFAGKDSSAGMIYPKDVGLVYTPIPDKYEDLATTDVKHVVPKGKSTFDIQLVSK